MSVPLFQFILLRWYVRFLIWFWFLLRVSHLKLHLPALHPDRAGGLGFLGETSLAFAPLLFAHSALLAGQIASRILYDGGTLLASELTIAGYVVFSIVAALAPLSSFTAKLIRAKLRGLEKYGAFASSYVMDFDQKWLQGKVNDEPAMGSGDIQSLADLGNSFAAARGGNGCPLSPIIADNHAPRSINHAGFQTCLLSLLTGDVSFSSLAKVRPCGIRSEPHLR